VGLEARKTASHFLSKARARACHTSSFMRAIPSLFFSFALAAPVLAATQPQKTTPLESKSQSKSLVQQLLREGKIMRASDAKRGQRGYALSVFQGTKIERFQIEVLGTLERVQSGGDLVMIKVLDGPVVKRQSGIIQGMSGSPVYINGKLLGAIAIGFGFPKEPIGGVTPITQMIQGALPDDSAPRPNPELKPVVKPVSTQAVYQPKSQLFVAGREIKRVEVTRDPRLAALDGSTMRMRPCTNYVLLSGVSPRNLAGWQKLFAPYDVTPVLGGGAMSRATQAQAFGMSSRKTGIKASLVPGAGIGVQLASGDIDVSGVGTVTYRTGQRVLAFGHPMFGLGAVSMPMTTAYVHDIFPSYDTSFKLASPIAPVGELQQDTAFAVGGTVGRKAQTIPMAIHVRDDLKHINRTFHINLIQDPLFTPQLATQTATEAVQGELGLDAGKTVRTSLRLKLRGLPEIVRSDVTYSDDPIFTAALGQFSEALGLSQSNPFEKGALQSVFIDAEVVSGRKTATIRRLFADRNRVKAGDTVNLSVALSPSNQPDKIITRRFSVKVPSDAPDGVLRVAVSPASGFWSARARVGGAPPRPGNLKELLQAYSRLGRSDDLLLQVSTPRRFLLVDRKRVDNPPSSWNRLIGGVGASSIASYNETLEAKQPSGYVLDGLETLTLPVEGTRRSGREKPDAPADPGRASASASSDAATASDSSSSSTPVVIELPDGAPLSTLRATTAPETRADWAQKLFGPGGLRALELQVVPRVDRRPREPVTPSATVTPTPTATVIPTPTPVPTPDAGAANIARPAGKWIQKGATDFARGEFSGSLVRADGTLGVGPTSKLVASTPENVAWSVAGAPDGTTYIGTGNNARLFKVRNGVSKVIYEGPEVAISALVCDAAGNLYAGTSPGGRVYRFAPNGTKTTVLQAPEEFVGALAFDGSGNLLVGTGGARGAVYRVENPATTHLLDASATPFRGPVPVPGPIATTTARHIRSLAFSNGAIYAGTSDDATLLRIGENGRVETLYEVRSDAASSVPTPEGATTSASGIPSDPSAQANPQAAAILAALGLTAPDAGARSGEITGVAPRGDAVYFSVLSSGSVFRWTRARGVEEAAKTGARAVYSLRASSNGTLYAGTGESGELFQITPKTDDTFDVASVLDGPQNQVSALEVEADGRVLAGTSNNAALWQLVPGTGSGQYTSNVFDAGGLVRWGTLRALGSGFSIQTRSGETADPDATWSAFTPLGADQKVVSPPARYLQYRARLNQNSRFLRVETSFRSPNRAPKLTWTLPSGGEYLSGKKTLSWTATDPDSDPLRYSLEIEKNGAFVPVELSGPTQSTFELDTSKYADGETRLRIRASDATRNPDDPRETSLASLPFTIDNTAPALQDVQLRRDGALWNFSAKGTDATSPLAGAEWRVLAPATALSSTPSAPDAAKTSAKTPATNANDAKTPPTSDAKTGSASDAKTPSEWTALGASDGLFDSGSEAIVGRIDPAFAPAPLPVPLASGTRIEIRLRDAAGNVTTQTVVLP
jgi:hypothetical protein